MFVLVKLYPYSRNKNNEIQKGFKIYFTDIGLRNSIVHNFSKLDLRADKGSVFENFFIIERLKYLSYRREYLEKSFWQGERGLEIDYLETQNDTQNAFECKLQQRRSAGARTFLDNYPKASLTTITLENYRGFLI
jgi:predicted AAA+ superfamily ATPase